MKPARTLGWFGLLFVAALLAVEYECAVAQSSVKSNVSSRAETGSAILDDDDDDFVPYQGERFSVFDWMLFRAMGKKYSGNILISPISLKLALVLLYEGAQDQTAYELAGVMQLPVSRTATRDQFTTILKSLQAPSPSYTLNIGTRLYVDQSVLTRQRYGAIVKTFYGTDVINTNFSDTQPIAREINSWASNITHGNIAKMIDDDKSIHDSVMLVMNAMFFKGAWRRKYFAPENTRMAKFYGGNNQTLDVPFMNTISRFYYSEVSELNAKILRIPYDGQKFALYLILPYAMDGADQLMNDINPFILARHVWLMQDLTVDVSIPKFKFDFSSHLEATLRELGIRDIFDNTATLTGIARTKRTSKHLQVSDILQKTGIEVNENGTTAYAVTEVQIGNKIEGQTFHADHPFLFYIEDESTGTILYVGKVANPLTVAGSTETPNPEFPSRINGGVSNAVQPAVPASTERYNFFNIDLLQALNEELEGNVIVSPASAKLALTILAEGSGGRTRQEILATLRLPEDAPTIRAVAERTFSPLKSTKKGTEIDTASRIWIGQDIRLSTSYANVLQRYYSADVEALNFGESANSAKRINEWIRRATHNKITSLVDAGSINADTRMLLTSTLYFKGQWMKSFDRNNTRVRCFHVLSQGCLNSSFMENTAKYRYAYVPSLDADIVEIPYSDGKTSMLILLPSREDTDQNLRILSKDLSYISVGTLLASLEETEVELSLPKFTIESKLDLRPSLTRMGIRSVFDVSANLTGIVSDQFIRVTSVLQNAKIEVDEDGTVAAAATGIGIVPFIGSTVQNFTADRPFIFMIVDLETSGTLFSGRLMKPNANAAGSA